MSRNYQNSEDFRLYDQQFVAAIDRRATAQQPCRDRTQQCGHYGECLRCQADQGEDRCTARSAS